MKILVVPSWYPPNGGRFYRLQSESLAKLGHQVDVLILEEKGLTHKVNKKIDASKSEHLNELRNRFYRIPKWNNMNIYLFIRKFKKLLNKYLETNTPDVIMVHSAIWAGVVVAEIALLKKIPYVISEQRSSFFEDELPFANKRVEQVKFAMNNASLLIANSYLMEKALKTYSSNKVIVIPNMLETEIFKVAKNRESNNPFVFITVGNLIPVKGYDILLNSFSELSKTNPNILLKIIGQGNDLEKLKKQAVDLNISEKVVFCGYMTKLELIAEYEKANAFVSSSRKETFGVVLIEALSCGLPLVATKSGGPEDIVKDSNGYLAENENANSLQDKMQLMIDNIGSFDSESIRQNALDNYSENVVSKQLENELKKCLVNKKQ